MAAGKLGWGGATSWQERPWPAAPRRDQAGRRTTPGYDECIVPCDLNLIKETNSGGVNDTFYYDGKANSDFTSNLFHCLWSLLKVQRQIYMQEKSRTVEVEEEEESKQGEEPTELEIIHRLI